MTAPRVDIETKTGARLRLFDGEVFDDSMIERFGDGMMLYVTMPQSGDGRSMTVYLDDDVLTAIYRAIREYDER